MQTTPKSGSFNPRGGAPKGNRNAVTAGRYTARKKALRKQINDLLKRAHVAVAEVEGRLPKRKPGPNLGSKRLKKAAVAGVTGASVTLVPMV